MKMLTLIFGLSLSLFSFGALACKQEAQIIAQVYEVTETQSGCLAQVELTYYSFSRVCFLAAGVIEDQGINFSSPCPVKAQDKISGVAYTKEYEGAIFLESEDFLD